jgi:hypothetical protein
VAEAAPTPQPAGPGRPRPPETRVRDELVFEALVSTMTREEIVAKTGIDKKLVYLSLYRLRRDGRIQRLRDGGAHKWGRI